MIFQTILVKSTCTAPLHDHHHLRYIRKIGYCAAYHLKRAIILPAQAIALVREPMPWQELPIVGLASLDFTEEVEKGTRTTTAKLSAKLCKSINLPISPLSFRLTDVQGRTFLLGTAESPHPLVTFAKNVAENPSGEARQVLSLECKSTFGLLKPFMFYI